MRTKKIKILVGGRITDNDMNNIKAGNNYCEGIPGQEISHINPCSSVGEYVTPCPVNVTPCTSNITPCSLDIIPNPCENIPGQPFRYANPDPNPNPLD